MRVLSLVAFVAALPGQLRGCGAPECYLDACPGNDLVCGFLSDPDTCGSRSTAVECVYACPHAENPLGCSSEPMDLRCFVRAREVLAEATDFTEARPEDVPAIHCGRGIWALLFFEGPAVRTLEVPPGLGTPVIPPFAAVRSDSGELVPGETRMSAYFLTSNIVDGCVLDMGVVWSWTLTDWTDPLFAYDLEESLKILHRHGDCDRDGLPRKGSAWKMIGKLYRPEGCSGTGEGPCGPDGWLNPLCVFDPDDPCHYDGSCEEFCPGDLDCGCGWDLYCNPVCLGTDPDCPCGPDGRCNPLCDGDPDCECVWDGRCNDLCLYDPDCTCVEDGVCSPVCGWLDPDCLCAADGVCNAACEEDPDCECPDDGYCDPGCPGDPDCAPG